MQSLDNVKGLVKEKLKDHPKRYKHTLGVAKMAVYLAGVYGIDKEKAEIAALMHDYSKYDDVNDALTLLPDYEIEECEKFPFLYHAYLSAENYLKLVGNDKEIYNAIKYHVFGRPKMGLLEAIIMISDYTEENREYPDCIKCREILLRGDFNLAIYESLVNTVNLCIKEGQTPHPKQLLVMEEYKIKAFPKTKLEAIYYALGKVKAKDVILYDVNGHSPYFDSVLIASTTSDRQATSLVDYIDETLTNYGYKILKKEGLNTPWVLIDTDGILISIFEENERNRFQIDKLYMEYPSQKIEL